MNEYKIKKIKELLESPEGKDLKDFLLEKFQNFQSIERLESHATPSAQTIELKAHKKALSLIREIYLELIDRFENAQIIEEKAEEDKLFSL